MAAPFERAFDAQALAEKEEDWDPASSQLMTIHYRDGEAIYVQNRQDRVTVIFSTLFKEETDRIFAKVFLQVIRSPYFLCSYLCRKDEKEFVLINCVNCNWC